MSLTRQLRVLGMDERGLERVFQTFHVGKEEFREAVP